MYDAVTRMVRLAISLDRMFNVCGYRPAGASVMLACSSDADVTSGRCTAVTTSYIHCISKITPPNHQRLF